MDLALARLLNVDPSLDLEQGKHRHRRCPDHTDTARAHNSNTCLYWTLGALIFFGCVILAVVLALKSGSLSSSGSSSSSSSSGFSGSSGGGGGTSKTSSATGSTAKSSGSSDSSTAAASAPVASGSTLSGSAVVTRTGGTTPKATAAAMAVNQNAWVPSAGNYAIMNIATQQYVSFLADGIAYSPYSTAAVIGFELASDAIKTWGSGDVASSDGTTSYANATNQFVLQGTTDSCAAAQFYNPTDGSAGYNQVMTSYNCYTKAASPLTKFAWYFLPESAGSDVPATIKRSTQSYYIIVSEYLAASPTSALTGANMSAFNNNLGIALTNFDDTDPWQLFTITSV